MSAEPTVDIPAQGTFQEPGHNLIFQKFEEKRLDELFQSKCHTVSLLTSHPISGWHDGLD